MRCRKVQKLLPLYGDGKLSPRTAEGIEPHLAECGECTREAAELEDALGALRALPRLRPAPAFKRAVIAAVRREAVRTRQGAWEWVIPRQPALATVAVTACMLLGAVALWMHGRQTPVPKPVPDIIAASPAAPLDIIVEAEESNPTPVAEREAVRPGPRARTTRVAMAARHVREDAFGIPPVRPARRAPAPKAAEERAPEALPRVTGDEPAAEASVGLPLVAAAGTYETVKEAWTQPGVGSEVVAGWILAQPWTLPSISEEAVPPGEGDADVAHL